MSSLPLTDRSLTYPPFEAATSCTASAHGIGGVLFLHWHVGPSIALKALPDAQEAAASLFCRSLCGAADVAHPEVEVLWLDTERGRALRDRVRELVAAEPSTRRGQLLEGCVATLLMECVEASELLPEAEPPPAAMARLELPGVAEQLGRITAVDAVLNNWDRLPLGIPAWRAFGQETVRVPPYPGNADNLLYRETDRAVVAIDTDMKRYYPENTPVGWQPIAPLTTDTEYVEQLGALFAALRSLSAAHALSTLAQYVRGGLERIRRGVRLSDGAMLAFQRGFIAAMDWMEAADLRQLHASAVREAGLSEEARSAALVQRARRVLDVWRLHNPTSTEAEGEGVVAPQQQHEHRNRLSAHRGSCSGVR